MSIKDESLYVTARICALAADHADWLKWTDVSEDVIQKEQTEFVTKLASWLGPAAYALRNFDTRPATIEDWRMAVESAE